MTKRWRFYAHLDGKLTEIVPLTRASRTNPMVLVRVVGANRTTWIHSREVLLDY